MTPVNISGGDEKRERRTVVESEAGYRWTCPLCGRSRLNISTDESGEKNAMTALRTHINVSDGDGHGPRNSYPSEFLTLSQHVVEVEGRRSGTGLHDNYAGGDIDRSEYHSRR